MYLEIYPTNTLYILDIEKVDEVLRELFSRIGTGECARYRVGEENKDISRRLRSSFLIQ